MKEETGLLLAIVFVVCVFIYWCYKDSTPTFYYRDRECKIIRVCEDYHLEEVYYDSWIRNKESTYLKHVCDRERIDTMYLDNEQLVRPTKPRY